jgi:hypothetical protein
MQQGPNALKCSYLSLGRKASLITIFKITARFRNHNIVKMTISKITEGYCHLGAWGSVVFKALRY